MFYWFSKLFKYSFTLKNHFSFQSVRFKDITLAATNQVRAWKSTPPTSTENSCKKPLDKISAAFWKIKENQPSLLLLWSHILGLLDFKDQDWWSGFYSAAQQDVGDNTGIKWKWTEEILQKGSLLIYCGILADHLKVRLTILELDNFYDVKLFQGLHRHPTKFLQLSTTRNRHITHGTLLNITYSPLRRPYHPLFYRKQF